MSLQTPTVQEISENLVAQIGASLNQTIPLLPKSFTSVLAKALAAVYILQYKYGGFMILQMFVSTASTKPTKINGKTITPLVEWGRLVGVGDPLAATAAELNISITVQSQIGSLPSGTQLLSTTGVTYITLVSVLLNAPTITTTVRAVSDQNGGSGLGTIGNLSTGSVLSFANPLANISRNAVVTAQAVTGADSEDMEIYRQRVLDRFQKRPQGGSYSDYELWGETVAGIKNVYPYTSTNPGQVDVYVESTTGVDGIPTTAQLTAVRDAINFDQSGMATRRPANALVNTFSIIRKNFSVAVTGLQATDLVQTRSSIEYVLGEYFKGREPYVVGLSVPPRKDRITKASVLSEIESVVSITGGIFTNAVIYNSLGVETDIYTLGIGEKAKLTGVTYV